MTKTEKKQSKGAAKAMQRPPIVDASGAIDWTPFVGAANDALRWTSDLAHELARTEEEDVRIAGVFAALGALLDGDDVERVPIVDVLLVLRTVGAAIERDQHLASGAFDLLAAMLGVAFGGVDHAHRAPAPMRTIYHLARHVEPPVARAPVVSLAEICALANRIAALVGPSGPLAVDPHR